MATSPSLTKGLRSSGLALQVVQSGWVSKLMFVSNSKEIWYIGYLVPEKLVQLEAQISIEFAASCDYISLIVTNVPHFLMLGP